MSLYVVYNNWICDRFTYFCHLWVRFFCIFYLPTPSSLLVYPSSSLMYTTHFLLLVIPCRPYQVSLVVQNAWGAHGKHLSSSPISRSGNWPSISFARPTKRCIIDIREYVKVYYRVGRHLGGVISARWVPYPLPILTHFLTYILIAGAYNFSFRPP